MAKRIEGNLEVSAAHFMVPGGEQILVPKFLPRDVPDETNFVWWSGCWSSKSYFCIVLPGAIWLGPALTKNELGIRR